MSKVSFVAAAVWLAACGQVDEHRHLDGGNQGSNGDAPGGGAAALEVSPASYEFGSVAPNATSTAVTFTFTNTGGAAATGCTAPTKTGANPGEFMIASDGCGTMDLAAGGSCTVTVAAKPTTAGVKTMTLSRTCAAGGTASTAADGLGANKPMYIFITSTKYNGNLGGLAGADTICNNAGTSGTLTSGLNKQWKALLSMTTGGTTINAKDRFKWTGPLYNVSTEMVVQNPAVWPWVATSANANINKNQNGGPPGDAYVWSASNVDGTAKQNLDCNGWTDESQSFSGRAGQTGDFPANSSWLDAFSNFCDNQFFTLYCISQ